MQIVLAPLDESTGEARSAPPSSVTLKLQPQEKLRRRTVDNTEEIAVGGLRIEVKAEPLTITVRGPSGDVAQTITFDANTAYSFLCAHSAYFNCPLVLANSLDVELEFGEKYPPLFFGPSKAK